MLLSANFEGCVGSSEGPRVSHPNFWSDSAIFASSRSKNPAKTAHFGAFLAPKKGAKMAPKWVVLAGVFDILAGRLAIWA